MPTPKYVHVYKIIIEDNWDDIIKDNNLYDHLATVNPKNDDDGWKYGLFEINKDNDFIYGIFGQEEDENLLKYDSNKNRIPFPDHPWTDTFFAISLSKPQLYIHKRIYRAKNLEHGKCLSRFEKLLTKELEKTVLLVPYKDGLNSEEFKKVFYENIVLEIKFTDIAGKFVNESAKLHNPKEEWDMYRAKSHNSYDANIIKTAVFEAAKGQNISKSPTARAFLEAGATGEKIKYLDGSGNTMVQKKNGDAIFELITDATTDEINELYRAFRLKLD